jgi:uncharacterized ferritin-like protein (DUF455 family)
MLPHLQHTQMPGMAGRTDLHSLQTAVCCMELSVIDIELKCDALQPPFNEEARAAAGFGPEWYLPLSSVIFR